MSDFKLFWIIIIIISAIALSFLVNTNLFIKILLFVIFVGAGLYTLMRIFLYKQRKCGKSAKGHTFEKCICTKCQYMNNHTYKDDYKNGYVCTICGNTKEHSHNWIKAGECSNCKGLGDLCINGQYYACKCAIPVICTKCGKESVNENISTDN